MYTYTHKKYLFLLFDAGYLMLAFWSYVDLCLSILYITGLFLACNTLWGEIPVISLQEFSESHPQNLLLFFRPSVSALFYCANEELQKNKEEAKPSQVHSLERTGQRRLWIFISKVICQTSQKTSLWSDVQMDVIVASCHAVMGLSFFVLFYFHSFYYRGCVVTLFSFSWYFLLHLHDITFKGTDVGTELHQFKLSGGQVTLISILFGCLLFNLLQIIWA